MKFGESLAEGEPPRQGMSTKAMQDAFFGFMEPPRITSDDRLRKAIARGAKEAFSATRRVAGPRARRQVSGPALAKVALSRPMSEDEVDLDDGFLVVPVALPAPAEPPAAVEIGAVGGTGGGAMTVGEGPATTTTGGQQPAVAATGGGAKPTVRTSIRITFVASRDEVFKSFPAIANLADKSDGGKISVVIDGQCAAGYDANWLRNAVREPLDEANIDGLNIE